MSPGARNGKTCGLDALEHVIHSQESVVQSITFGAQPCFLNKVCESTLVSVSAVHARCACRLGSGLSAEAP